jgi:hypothetical protein
MAENNSIPASNMYIWWNTGNQAYDMIVGEFCCSNDAISTYWAFQCWANGYLGFQLMDVLNNGIPSYVAILGIFDLNSTDTAEVEYYTIASQGTSFDSGGSEPGAHIFSLINWSVGVWYRIAVGVKSDANKTYYAYWVTPSSNTNWVLYGIISLPGANKTITTPHSFLEDLGSGGELRGCRYSNVYGRYASSGVWTYFNSGTITSMNTNYTPHDNCKNNCDCGKGVDPNNNYEYVYTKSGTGAGWCTKDLPYYFSCAYSDVVPSSYPTFPSYIKSYHSNLYAAPSSSTQDVIQRTDKYWWVIENAGNGYVYILTTDRTQALSITGTNNGDNLKYATFSTSDDKQKWELQLDSNNRYYIIPKNASAKGMDIKNNATTNGAKLQIYTRNTTAARFKWYVY